MRVLVTGATGLVGSHLVRRLVSKGVDVTIVHRPTSSFRALQHFRPKQIVADITDCETLSRAMEGMDKVYHCAGLVSYSPVLASELERVNVKGTKAVVEAAKRANIGRLIHMSSIVTIGGATPNTRIDESAAYNLGAMHIPYFETKRAGEKIVLDAAKEGLDAVVVNPGSILGPYDYKFNASSYVVLLAKHRLRWLLPGGTNVVDVEDVVEGTLRAGEKGKKGERYILGGENIFLADFIQRIAEVIGIKSPQKLLPAVVRHSLILGLRIAEKIGIEFRLSSDLIMRLTQLHLFYDLRKAKEELGYDPQPIDGAIKRTFEWLKQIEVLS